MTVQIDIEFTLNGRPAKASVPPGMSVLTLLRGTLGMTGTKYACGPRRRSIVAMVKFQPCATVKFVTLVQPSWRCSGSCDSQSTFSQEQN